MAGENPFLTVVPKADTAIPDPLAPPPAPPPMEAPARADNAFLTVVPKVPEGLALAPPPEPAVGPDSAQVAELTRWQQANSKLTPGDAGDVLKYSAATGADPQWVADNLAGVRKELDASQVPWQQLWEDHPALRDFIGDPVKAAAIRDDSAALPAVLKWTTGGFVDAPIEQLDPYFASAFGSPVPAGHYVAPAWASALKVGAQEAELALRKAMAASPVLRDFLEPWFNFGSGRTYLPPDEWAQKNQVASKQLERLTNRDYDTNVAGRAVLGAVKMVPTLAGAAAAGAVGGGVAAGGALVAKAGFWALQGYGQLYETLGEITGPEGEKLSETERQMLAVGFSVAGGAAMEVGLERIMKGFGIGGMKKVIAETADRALASPTLLRLFGGRALDLGKATLSGAAAMGVQAGLNATAVAMGQSSVGLETTTQPAYIAEQAWKGFVDAIPTMVVLGLAGPTRAYARDIGDRIRTNADVRQLQGMGEAARASVLRERFSQGFNELVDRAGAQPGAADTVYASLGGWDRFWQAGREGKTADPRQVAASILGDEGKAYDLAKQTGAPLAIPVSKYLDKIASNREVERALLPDLRLDLEGRTLREHAEQRVRDQELMARIRAEPLLESDAAAQAVKKDFLDKATLAGQPKAVAEANAENIARIYRYAEAKDRPRAEAAGESPYTSWDFYTKLAPIEIAGWKEANRQSPAPGVVDLSNVGPERRALLQRAASGDRAAILELHQSDYTDALTGLGSMKAHIDFLHTQPDRAGVHVIVDLPGVGQVNNRFGQSAGDAYVSGAAQALHEASQAERGKAHRIGGDELYFHFDTQAQADAFLASGREAVAGLHELAPGVRASFYAGAGATKAAAETQLRAAKTEAKKKYGDSKVNPDAIGHGESFVRVNKEGVQDIPRAKTQQLLADAGGFSVALDKKAQDRLAQPAGEGPGPGKERGAVVFTPLEGGRGVRASIELFTSADASTLAHETAHVFSRLLEELAAREGATPEVKADYQALLQAMGYASAAERAAAREERQRLEGTISSVVHGPEHQKVTKRLQELRAKEERVSYQWEQYLAEGKAPEAALVGSFARFKGWLLKIYKSVQGVADTFQREHGEALGPISPETRALFDRLLTSSEEAGKATAAAGLHELPGADAEVSKAFADARAEAEQRLLRAVIESDRKQAELVQEQERAKLRDELGAQVDADPVQAAVATMRAGGTDVLKGPGGEPIRLNRAELVKALGAEAVRALAREHPGIFAPKGQGMPADQVAAFLGFENGADLVEKLQAARNRDALVEAQVTQRMHELYGKPLIEDPQALGAAALDAAATPKAAAAIIKEMGRLVKDLADPTQDVRARGVNWTQMEEAADRMVVDGRVADLSPTKYQRSMEAAGRRAFEAMQKATGAKTDQARRAGVQRAYEERDQQLWALAMYRAAEKEKVALDQRFEELQKTAKTAWRSEIGKADVAYVDAHDSILEAVGIGNVPPDTSGRRGGIDALVAQAVADAGELPFDVDVVRGVVAAKTPWKDLTVGQAWEVSAAIQSIRAIANAKNEVTILGKRVTRTNVLEEMARTVEQALPSQPKFEDDPKVMGARAMLARNSRLAGQHIDALLMDIGTVTAILDGGNRSGVFHQVFVDGRLEAREKRNELTRAFLKTITGSFEKSGLDRKRLYEVLQVPELQLTGSVARFRTGERRTRANLLMMALNLGNDSNAERFLGGYGWDRQQVEGVLSKHLNGKELRWVQDVWNALEGKGGGPSLYEEMARVHQEETGLRPEKITATPFKLRSQDGELVELQGGYFPARYDPRPGSEKKTGEKQLQDTISAFFQDNYTRGGLAPYSPHAKARAEHFQDLVNLDWGIVPAHVSQVIQDISYRRYAKQTAAIVLDARFKNLMVERLGEARAAFFEPWLKAVVNQTADSIPADLRWSDRIMGGLRSRAAIASIGWSIPVALGDLSNPLTALATGDLKARYLALAAAKQGRSWKETRAFVLENSLELRERGERLAHKFRESMAQMGGSSGMEHPWLRGMRDSAFVTMEMSDRVTSTPVWMAKFEQSQAEGMSHAESVRAADDLVRKILPPEDIADKPRILRSKGLSSFLLFYGYANKIWNIERMAFHEAWGQWRSDEASIGDKMGATARLAGTILAVSAVNGVIGEYFSGRGKQQDESLDEWLERKLIAALFYPVPFVGALGDWVGGKFVAAAHNKDMPLAKPSLRNAPAIAFVQDTLTRLDSAITKWGQGDADAGAQALHAVELLLGLGVGAPTRQVEKTGTAALHLITGDSPATGYIDATGNLVYGEGDQANPLKDLQRATE